MKRALWVWLLVAMLLCACDRPRAPTPTPIPTATLRPAASSTPVPTRVPVATATVVPSPTTASLPTAAPTVTSPSIIYDGEWEGVTALGLPVSFTVKDNLVTHFAAQWHTAKCDVTTEPDLPEYGTIENRSFSIGSYFGSALLGFTWHFSGTFTSPTKATGKFSALLGSCGSVNTTWEASRK